MGNGDRSGYMGGGGQERTTSLDFDVGLGLKMQETEESSSYPCKRTMVMPHQFIPFQHHQQQFAASDSTSFHGGNGGGGGALFCDATSNQVVASVSDIFDANLGASSSAAAVVSGEGMKAPFTALQWQELERQTMIYKYLMASNNVPADVMLPLTKNTSHVSISQSNTASGLDLKFSSGSDPEPWRCRRTDGKKWRCSRDVAPDQKYCERHAHKSRPRSRKHVETQPHNATTTNYSQKQPQQHPLILPGDATSQLFQKPISHSTTMSSATTYDQTRNSIMWFMRGGSDTIPVSTCNQQRQQQPMMQSSSRMGLNRDNSSSYEKKMSVFQQQYEDKQDTININPYMYCDNSGQRPGNYQLNGQYCSNSFLDPKMASFQGSLNDDHTTIDNTTRHFIDAWSTAAENTGLHEIGNNDSSISSSRKLPLSSLTLSMSGGNVIDEENERVAIGIGMTNDDEEALKSQWMMSSPISWMNSTTPPGGPLGEALCLGIAGTAKGASSNLPSPHGCSNSSANSSCSKGSCEDGSHQFNFIG